MDKTALEQQLQEITNARDDGRLEELVKSLSAEELELYKRELADAFLDIYAVWQYDFICDKVITNEGPAMAAIYHSQNEQSRVKALFERGQDIFLKIYEPENDFTANIYWGEFLINYARLVYDFASPAILQAAKRNY